MTTKVFKTAIAPVEKAAEDEYRFVLSSDSRDRYGDIVRQSGWDLSNFRQNPMALWSHDSREPIGTWKSVRVADGKLRGTLKFVERGISAVADKIRGLVDKKVLKTVSVGFIPLEWKYIEDGSGRGIEFLKSELLECSVVAIPANADALIQAGFSKSLIRQTFGRTTTLAHSTSYIPGSTVLFELEDNDYIINDARPGGLYGQIASDYHEGYDDGYAAGVASARKVAAPTRSFISPPTPRYEIDTDQVGNLVKGAVRRSLTDSVKYAFRKTQGKLD